MLEQVRKCLLHNHCFTQAPKFFESHYFTESMIQLELPRSYKFTFELQKENMFKHSFNFKQVYHTLGLKKME